MADQILSREEIEALLSAIGNGETDLKHSAVDAADSPAHHQDHPDTGIDLNRMDIILDIPLKISVELGRIRMPIKDLLKLRKGSVIELDKIAGEDLEILVNQKIFAKGEVVMTNENYGVRITEVISSVGSLKRIK
jgi:flagellar motor switch protein FliN/FliY